MKKQTNKKQRERVILDLVYKDRSDLTISPSEDPDFKLKNNDGLFGVEITEFYFSHSRARVNNIPGYVSEIINNKKYRHKEDILSLAVSEMTLTPKDDNTSSRQIKGIFQKQPPINDYVCKVAELIESKNQKFKNYAKNLNHSNLIIFDHENLLLHANKDQFHRLFYLPCLEKSLLDSNFREIFFITKIGGFNTPKYVYVPLKMLFLIAELYTFNYIVSKEYSKQIEKIVDQDSVLFSEYLEWRGAKNLYIGDNTKNLEVAYGNSGVLVTDENKVNIYDYNDLNIPKRFNLFLLRKPLGIFDKKFSELFAKYKTDYTFSAELCFDTTDPTQDLLI